jgi:hypothetical protein
MISVPPSTTLLQPCSPCPHRLPTPPLQWLPFTMHTPPLVPSSHTLTLAVASYGDDQSMMEDGREEANQMVREVEGLQNVPSRGDQAVEADRWQSMAAAPSTVIIHGGINVRSSLRLSRGGGRVRHRRGSGAAATLEPWAVSGWVRARLSQQI